MLISIFALLVSSTFAQAPLLPAASDVHIADAASIPALQALFDSGDFEAMAAQSGDVVLLRRVIGLKRALAQQQRAHEQLPEFHPRRDAADDRVRLLEASVTQAAAMLADPSKASQLPEWAPLPDPHSKPFQADPKAEASEL